ncbi:MAG: 3-methyl-2-oxobutanoate dehydrogenase subunit VorB [Acidobacteria bacterium]|nr:3-methyl-2-oxobutanoate dehydrogenase subunit VorB [Acidobacteriota bacterium]
MAATADRTKPIVVPDYCKGCGRCIDACEHHCIEPGRDIDPATGLVPVRIHLEHCTACGLCFDACPEPYGLRPAFFDAEGSERPRVARHDLAGTPTPEPIPDAVAALPPGQPLVIKGVYASAVGAILAGCRHFFGYPITPSTEGAELMARLLPHLDGQFVQAVSEVAAINMMYGAGAAGVRATTFTSSPGFSLMLEGLSYMVGATVPGVVVNVMRGGPGLGNIAPGQSDIKLACRGLGHGDTHAIVLAPSTPQEMLDLTMLAFDLSFKYRNPVIVLADGYVAQMTGRVTLPRTMVRPGVPAWAVAGDEAHRRNLITSIYLSETELEARNERLFAKYARITDAEPRADLFQCDDAELLIVACNTPARMAKGAVRTLRAQGVKAGLFRPLTLWPFPICALAPVLSRARRVVVVEASDGQLEDEMRLAISRADLATPSITSVNRYGGVLPSHDEIVSRVIGVARPHALGATA